MGTNSKLYAEDFFDLTQTTAALIRAGKWHDVDPESLGARDHGELRPRLQRLVTHLLKWQYQASGCQIGHSWRSTIRTQRDEIAGLLEQSPSLRRTVPEVLHGRYRRAREGAIDQTRLPLTTFPEACPWTPEQVLDEDFWPDEESTREGSL